jgi:transcription elongation factor Elf1
MKWKCIKCNHNCTLEEELEQSPACPFPFAGLIPEWVSIGKKTFKCKTCGEDFQIKVSQSTNLEAVTICQKCMVKRAKVRQTVTCAMCGNNFEIRINPNTHNSNIVVYCHTCQRVVSERNKENKELNNKLNRAGIHSINWDEHLLAMDDRELKRHLRDGDVYVDK